jgi:hypothetical protein
MDNISARDDSVVAADVEKAHKEHIADVSSKPDEEIVVDRDAAGYVDHNVVIDEATNKRLLKMINWRYVNYYCIDGTEGLSLSFWCTEPLFIKS